MFDIPKKLDKDNAYDDGLKCSIVLRCLREWTEDKEREAFKNSKTIEDLDKQIEDILYKYYYIGNKIVDYYEIKGSES